MSKLHMAVPVVIVLCAVSAALGGEAVQGPDVARIAELMEKIPRDTGDSSVFPEQSRIMAEILSAPAVAEDYLERLFDPALDELFAPLSEKQLSPERRELLTKVRGFTLQLIQYLDRPEMRSSADTVVRAVPAEKRPGAARFLDRLCAEIRPKLLERAMIVHKSAIWTACLVGDLRLEKALDEALRAHPDLEERRSGYTAKLLCHAAGRRETMRNSFNDPATEYEACEYLKRTGDADQVVAHIIARLEQGRPAWGPSLMRLDCPKARAAVIELLKTRKPKDTEAFWSSFPDFFDEERARLVIPLLRAIENQYRTPHPVDKFFDWVRKNKSTVALEYARSCGRESARAYLLAMGDQKTIEDALATMQKHLEKMRSTNPQERLNGMTALRSSALSLGQAGLWDQVPADACHAPEGEYDHTRRELMKAAEETNDPKAIPTLRAFAKDPKFELRAKMRALELSDQELVPEMKRMLPELWGFSHTRVAAALYRQGDASLFDDLASALRTEGYSMERRSAAARALGQSPAEAKARAARALAPHLLDRYGPVSEAANAALVELTGRKDIAFSPWEVDAVRKPQALVWGKAVQDIFGP